MRVQIENINKTYPDYNALKLKTFLKIDDDLLDSTELQECYEDAVSFCESYIQKDIAKTLKQYKFYDFAGDTLIIDEGNYISISSITYTKNSVSYSVESFGVRFDGNKIYVDLPYGLSVQDNDYIMVLLYTGYEQAKMHKNARRAVYSISDKYYNRLPIEDKTISNLLNPLKKDWHYNYSK